MAHFFSNTFLILFLGLWLFVILTHWILVHLRGADRFFSKRGLRYGSLVYIVVILAIGGWIDGLGKPKSTTSSTPPRSERPAKSPVKAKAATSSSSVARSARDTLKSLNTTQLAQFNDELTKSLAEDHDFANQGSTAYQPHTYIDSLTYDHNRGLLVHVRDQFLALPSAERGLVVDTAQNITAGQLTMSGHEIAPGRYGISTTIYHDGNKIGRSKVTNLNQYKWNK